MLHLPVRAKLITQLTEGCNLQESLQPNSQPIHTVVVKHLPLKYTSGLSLEPITLTKFFSACVEIGCKFTKPASSLLSSPP